MHISAKKTLSFFNFPFTRNKIASPRPTMREMRGGIRYILKFIMQTAIYMVIVMLNIII